MARKSKKEMLAEINKEIEKLESRQNISWDTLEKLHLLYSLKSKIRREGFNNGVEGENYNYYGVNDNPNSEFMQVARKYEPEELMRYMDRHMEEMRVNDPLEYETQMARLRRERR